MTSMPPPLSPMTQKRIEALLRLYRDSQARINKQLASAATTNFKKWRLNEELAQINRIVDALDEAARNASGKIIPTTYGQGADIARDAMIERGMDLPAVNLGNKIHTASVQALADQMAADMLGANASIKRMARRILMQTQQTIVDESQINDIIGRGLVEGASRRDVSSGLRAALEKNLAKGAKVEIIGKDGKKRLYDPGDYAELVARTRTREAVTEGSVRFGMQHGVTLFQVSVHDNPCEAICAAKQGKIYSMVSGQGFPVLNDKPPFHPRCLHVLLPYVVADDSELARLRGFSNSKRRVANLAEYAEIERG